MEKLAQFLKSARHARQLNIRELALESNVTTAQISRIENGISEITVGALVRLAYGLDFDLGDIFQDFDNYSVFFRYRKAVKNANTPVPTAKDVMAFWEMYRDQPQLTKEFLIEGYYSARMKSPKGAPSYDATSELVWEATLAHSNHFFPIPYPTEITDGIFFEVYSLGGVITMQDFSSSLRIARAQKELSTKELANQASSYLKRSDDKKLSYMKILRLEKGDVERAIFEEVAAFDGVLKMEGELVTLAWSAAEYEAGIDMYRLNIESGKPKPIPTDWDPVQKAFSDTLITICRWHHNYGGNQNWWFRVKDQLMYYQGA